VLVSPTVETEPVSSEDDAADDPCIWVHPDDPALSLIIGTNKDGSLDVYDMQGKRLQSIPGMEPNNVDIRHEVGPNRDIDLVAFTDRKDNSIGLYRVNADTRNLEPVRHGDGVVTGMEEVYGMCLYRNVDTGEVHVFVNSKFGEVEQWRCLFHDDGLVGLEFERGIEVGGGLEGAVADDEAGVLYLGEEDLGIWRYDLRAMDRDEEAVVRTLVDQTAPAGRLVADVEGLALYLGEGGTGYLIASSQGNHTYNVYRREGRNEFLGSFRVVAGNGIDGTEETDGIDVSAAELGPGFEWGVFVAQDGLNDDRNQNFKLVPWQALATAFNRGLSTSGADVRD
jgi:3-phytase